MWTVERWKHVHIYTASLVSIIKQLWYYLPLVCSMPSRWQWGLRCQSLLKYTVMVHKKKIFKSLDHTEIYLQKQLHIFNCINDFLTNTILLQQNIWSAKHSLGVSGNKKLLLALKVLCKMGMFCVSCVTMLHY